MRKPDYNRRVVVTGLGVISPVGNDVSTAWSNLVNGVSGLGEITKFNISGYEHKAAGGKAMWRKNLNDALSLALESRDIHRFRDGASRGGARSDHAPGPGAYALPPVREGRLGNGARGPA